MSPGDFTEADSWGGRPVAHKISEATPRGRLVVSGVIGETAVSADHGSPSLCCTLDDGTGEIGLLFVGRRQVAGVVTGARCTVEGTARMEGGRLVVWNPVYVLDPVGLDHPGAVK